MFAPHPLDRGTSLEPERAPGSRRPGKEADIDGKLGRIEASLDRIDRRQTAALTQMQARYEGKARKMRSVLADLGLEARRQSAGRHRRPVRAGGAAFGEPEL